MTDRETLKLALEALEDIHPGNMTPMAEEYWGKAITAIRQALDHVPDTTKMIEPDMGIDRGAWDDVPDATKWVDELRGDETEQEQRERELNDVLTERDDAEDYIDALLDEILGPDRAEWSSAYGRADALEEVRERIAQMLKPSIDKAWNRFEAALEQQAEPKQEPVAWWNPRYGKGEYAFADSSYPIDFGWDIPLYTAPPKREWVGLTDEEIAEGAKQSWVDKQAFESAVWWAEERLKGKNS